MRALITILDNITETSMPFHEFVLYRARHYLDEKQILIICGPKAELPSVGIPKSLEIIYSGRRLINIRKTIKRQLAKLENAHIPYAVHIHQVQSGFLSELSMLGTGFRKKVLFTVHSTFSGYKFHNQFLSIVNSFLANQITCVSHTSYIDYPRIIKLIKGKRIQPLQNGVDTERIDNTLATTGPIIHDGCTFIYVARLIPLKNHLFLIHVLKQCDKRVHFVFVGAGESEKAIRQKADELEVADRIAFTGLIPRPSVYRMLQAADFYISSSTLEGLPVSVLEAMYSGLLCVLSDIPQHREIAGYEAVILPNDAKKWAQEINRLIVLSQDQRERMSHQIRTYAGENFSLLAMHKKYDAVYSMLR